MAKRKKLAQPEATPKKTRGRPLIEIDWDAVDNMAAIHCTGPEIACVLGVHEDTMSNACRREKKMDFSTYIRQKRGTGKASLRRRQWKAAEAGDRTMLVWLGKNWLEQTDKMEQRTHAIVETRNDLSRLTAEELRVLRNLKLKMTVDGVDS